MHPLDKMDHEEIMHDIKLKVEKDKKEAEYSEKCLIQIRQGLPIPKRPSEVHDYISELVYQQNLKEEKDRKNLARIRAQRGST